ncbi:MAG: GAF domain-containing protein, partial [Chloroflexia bacterium]
SGEVIGSISIQSRRPDAFSEQHLRILSFIADQAALAIEKARLYQAARERANELERIAAENARLYAAVREERDRLRLLQDVARDLTRRLDLDDLLQRLLQRAMESLKATDGVILLLGTRHEAPRAISAQTKPDMDLRLILERGLAGWVIQNREPALLPDVRQDPRWLPGIREVGSAVAVPVLHGETAWGAITLTHPEPGFFAQSDLTLLLALAEQAAVALEAARLYEAQRRRAVQLQTIAEVMRSILSILDLDRLLGQVVQLVRERFGYSHAHVFTVDAEREEVVFRASTDPANPFWEARGRRLSFGEGLVGWVAEHGQPAIVGDVCRDPRWLPDQRDVRSEVAVPLEAGGRVVGILDVQSHEIDAFDEEDLFVLRTLADQIAVALENARLYQSEQEEAWVLNALLQVAENIARARDLGETLEAVVRLVPLLIGVEGCTVLLRERESGVFRAVHGYGQEWQSLQGRTFDVRQVPALERVVKNASPLGLVRGSEEARSPDLGGLPPTGNSVWLFPLLAGGEVTSVLLVDLGKNGSQLSARQQTILSGLAHQAGIAIQGALLQQEAEARQRLEQELAVAREIQRRLLPECCPQLPGWSIDVAWEAAHEIGGDFYDFVMLPDGRLGLLVGDVSDKGVPAALFMVLSRSLVRASAVSHPSPAEVLLHVNRLLLEDSRAEMFVSAFYAVLDPRNGEMRYTSAGHNPALVVRADGATALLDAPGVILGVVPDARLEERSLRLEVGDILVLYTDGITETINRAEEEFGLERLGRIVSERRTDPLPSIRQAVLEALQQFGEGRPVFDDLTLLLLRRER